VRLLPPRWRGRAWIRRTKNRLGFMSPPRTPQPQSENKRILIVDDHPVVREGLVQQIGRETGVEVCGEASNAVQAMEAVSRMRPDLVLVDINLPGRSGLELIRDIHAVSPDLPILVLSMHDESVFAERVLRAGGRGYVSKHMGGEKLAEAIRHVLNGQIYVSETVSTRLLDGLSGEHSRTPIASPIAKLTDRELEVFTLIGHAKQTKDIAHSLHMSSKTVEAHRGAIKRKLKLKSGPELTRHAVLWVEATR
jgi:DNA-binding NarL/FixJ family response regulator